jgi:hypothetical protein
MPPGIEPRSGGRAQQRKDSRGTPDRTQCRLDTELLGECSYDKAPPAGRHESARFAGLTNLRSFAAPRLDIWGVCKPTAGAVGFSRGLYFFAAPRLDVLGFWPNATGRCSRHPARCKQYGKTHRASAAERRKNGAHANPRIAFAEYIEFLVETGLRTRVECHQRSAGVVSRIRMTANLNSSAIKMTAVSP